MFNGYCNVRCMSDKPLRFDTGKQSDMKEKVC